MKIYVFFNLSHCNSKLIFVEFMDKSDEDELKREESDSQKRRGNRGGSVNKKKERRLEELGNKEEDRIKSEVPQINGTSSFRNKRTSSDVVSS